LVAIAEGAGLEPQVQVGEPWWWVTPEGAICLYDDMAKAVLGGEPVEIADVRGALSPEQTDLPHPRRAVQLKHAHPAVAG
jgi:hypothetical protein